MLTITSPAPTSSISAAGNSRAPVSLPTTTSVGGTGVDDTPVGRVVLVVAAVVDVVAGPQGGNGVVDGPAGPVVDEPPGAVVVVPSHTVVVVVAHGSVVLLDEAVVDVEPSGAVVVVVSHGEVVVVVRHGSVVEVVAPGMVVVD